MRKIQSVHGDESEGIIVKESKEKHEQRNRGRDDDNGLR